MLSPHLAWLHPNLIRSPRQDGPISFDGDDRPARDAAASVPIDRDVDRIIVVSPGDGSSYLERLYALAGRAVPSGLDDWDARIDRWCDQYEARFESTRLLQVFVEHAVYWFDQGDRYERVVVAYGISKLPDATRDGNRMRRFPDVNVGVRANLGDESFDADRGHWLSHASGGELDINLFPQRRELNRGWSDEGKVFRRMESAAAGTPGTFHFHRAVYDDDTWIPATIQYGVLRDDLEWWVEDFANK